MEISAAEIKQVRALREKKFRDESGLFFVEGEKMVSEALASGFEVVRVYRREEVGEKVMERLSVLSTPSPVLAVLRQPEISPLQPAASGRNDREMSGRNDKEMSGRNDRKNPENQSQPGNVERSRDIFGGLCLALDAVRDPGNLGTIMRLADWFGIDTIFASPDTADVYNPKVIQASMGSIFRKRPIYCDLPKLCRDFKAAGMEVFGTFLGGENIYGAQLPKEGLIVMGNEAHGISVEVAAEVSRKITIPSFFEAAQGPESLNVAIATALTVSEFKRR